MFSNEDLLLFASVVLYFSRTLTCEGGSWTPSISLKSLSRDFQLIQRWKYRTFVELISGLVQTLFLLVSSSPGQISLSSSFTLSISFLTPLYFHVFFLLSSEYIREYFQQQVNNHASVDEHYVSNSEQPPSL